MQNENSPHKKPRYSLKDLIYIIGFMLQWRVIRSILKISRARLFLSLSSGEYNRLKKEMDAVLEREGYFSDKYKYLRDILNFQKMVVDDDYQRLKTECEIMKRLMEIYRKKNTSK